MIEVSTIGLTRQMFLGVILAAGTSFGSAGAEDKAKTRHIQVISGVAASNTARPAGRLQAGSASAVRVHGSAPHLRGGPESALSSQKASTGQYDCASELTATRSSDPQVIHIERQKGVLVVNQTRHRQIN